MKLISHLFLFFSLYILIFGNKAFHFFFALKKKPSGIIKSVIFLENLPERNAGYFYRSEKWSEIIDLNQIQSSIYTLITKKEDFERILKKSNKSCFFLLALWKRQMQVLFTLKYDVIIVRRELLLFNDYGNLFLEKFLLKMHPNVILDFDDDIAASKRQPKEITSLYGKLMLEDGNKFNHSLRLYKRFIVASNYLKEKVKEENPNVKDEDILVMPTCVDYDKYEQKVYQGGGGEICFGWIGGNYNYYLLESILPALEKISSEFKVQLMVIGGKPFEVISKVETTFVPWSMETEVESLKKIDVGLMPLFDDDVCRGKGGFKLIQYMGLGIVSLATGLTINNEIVDDGQNGFLVPPGADWYPYLKKVILAQADFPRIGANARRRILENYTFRSNAKRYIDFIKRI